jgi:hypothetical protein
MKNKIKQIASTLFIGTLILLLVNSCKKDFYQSPIKESKLEKSDKITSNGITLETVNFKDFKKDIDFNKLGKLKHTFEAQKENSSQIKLEGSTDDEFVILLDSLKKITTNGKTSFVFQIKQNNPRAASFRNLTIEKDGSGNKIKAFTTIYTPDKKWIEGYKKKQNLGWSGDIKFKTISLDDVVLPKVESNDSKQVNSSKAVNTIRVCETFYVYEVYPIPCSTGDMPWDECEWATDGSGMGPSWGIRQIMETECYDVGGGSSGGGSDGGGGGGGTTPNPPGGFDPCDSGGGTIGVESINGIKVFVAEPTPCDPPLPGDPYPLPPSSASFIITRDITITNNPKISCILNRLEGKDNNGNNTQTKYDDLLLAFSNNNNWNLTYKLEVIPNSPLGKITLGKRRGPENLSGVNNFEIVFNTNETGRYEIEIAKTFIHEAFHAYLAQKSLETWGTVNPLLWKNETKDLDLKQLLNYIEIEKGKDLGDLGHDFMINNIDKMKVVLKEFMDPNSQSSISDDAYLGWLYQGLEGTNFYENNVGTSNVVKQYNGNSYTLRQYYNQIAAELLTIDIDCL